MKYLTQCLSVIAAIGLATVTFTGIALAHGGAEVAVAPTSAGPNDSVDITIEGYEPDTLVSITLEGVNGSIPLGTATTDADGAVSVTLTLPADIEPGTYSLKAAGGDDNESTDLSVTGGSEAGGQGGESGFTYKQPTAQWVGLAIGIVVVGLFGFAIVPRKG